LHKTALSDITVAGVLISYDTPLDPTPLTLLSTLLPQEWIDVTATGMLTQLGLLTTFAAKFADNKAVPE